MKNKKPAICGLIHSLLTSAYVFFIAWLMFNGENFFGPDKNFFMPAALLMLFLISAAITSLLIFGRPVYLFLNNDKKEAVKLLFWTLGWQIFITLIVFLTLILFVK